MEIDFTEIVGAENWETFAKTYLEEMGYTIISLPDRGADGGKDMIVEETIKGIEHVSKLRWLVSCKHFAVSNKSVSENDERNILERVVKHKCDGFMGFYSTIVSSGLNNCLAALKRNKKNGLKDYAVHDSAKIRKNILKLKMYEILRIYCPISYLGLTKQVHGILKEYVPLNCNICRVDLLQKMEDNIYNGNILYIKDKNNKIKNIYTACEQVCSYRVEELNNNSSTQIIKLQDISSPRDFLDFILLLITDIKENNEIYSPRSIESLKKIIMTLSQNIFRNMTTLEAENLLKYIDKI